MCSSVDIHTGCTVSFISGFALAYGNDLVVCIHFVSLCSQDTAARFGLAGFASLLLFQNENICSAVFLCAPFLPRCVCGVDVFSCLLQPGSITTQDCGGSVVMKLNDCGVFDLLPHATVRARLFYTAPEALNGSSL